MMKRFKVLKAGKKGLSRIKSRTIRSGPPKYRRELQTRIVDLELTNKRLQREIMEREKAEAALRESELRFRALAKLLPETIFEADLKGILTFVNYDAFEKFGYTPEEFQKGIKALEMVDESDRPRATQNFIRVIGGEDIGLSEYNFIRKDKSVFPALIRSTRIMCEDRLLGLRGIIIDISERKKMEQALKESEEKYRSLVTQSPDGIFVVDLEGGFLSVNEAMSKALGRSEEEILNMKIWDFIPPAFLEQHSERLAGIINGIRQQDPAEYEVIGKNGQLYHVEILSSPFYHAGQIIGFQGIARDISERKRMEQEQKRLESQLRQSQKMEAIGTLAGGIAHDFNNILAAIIGYAELALYNLPVDSHYRDHLEHILKSGFRAKKLVQQILSFSRKTEQERKPIKISSIIKEVLKLLRATLPATIEIRQSIASNVSNIVGDPIQIHQVMMNLCTNAADAMKDKGGVIHIGLSEIDLDETIASRLIELKPGRYCLLCVTDTGQGMDAREMERIFEPYYTTKEYGQGTGLGLAMAHGIVKSHGGAIDLESEKGKGTSFYVYFPVTRELKSSQTTKDIETHPKGQGRILFVDDEESVVDINRQYLELLGYRVKASQSSLEALEIFERNPRDFDLVITDMTMPKMTGLLLSRRILEIRPDIPIILCTGYSDQVNGDTITNYGISMLLMKPLAVRELARVVKDVLTKIKPPIRTDG